MSEDKKAKKHEVKDVPADPHPTAVPGSGLEQPAEPKKLEPAHAAKLRDDFLAALKAQDDAEKLVAEARTRKSAAIRALVEAHGITGPFRFPDGRVFKAKRVRADGDSWTMSEAAEPTSI